DLVVRSDLLGVLLEVLDDRLDREVDAALEVHRVHAGGHRLRAFLDDGGGQHGRGGGAVAGDVGGLGSNLTHHLRAHVLELVLELDLLGDGPAVLGDARGAEALVEHDVAALGAERHLHRIVENVDAAQHLVACLDREFDFLGSHYRVSQTISGVDASGGLLLGHALFDDAHDVALLHDQEIFAIDLDLGARPLPEQHAVADPDVDRDQLAGLIPAAGADGEHLALRRLLLGGVGNDDAAFGLLLGIDTLDDNAVVKRTKLHDVLLR